MFKICFTVFIGVYFLMLKTVRSKICCSSDWQIALSFFQCVLFSAFRFLPYRCFDSEF